MLFPVFSHDFSLIGVGNLAARVSDRLLGGVVCEIAYAGERLKMSWQHVCQQFSLSVDNYVAGD